MRTSEQEERALEYLRQHFGTDDYNQSDVNGIDLFAIYDRIRFLEAPSRVVPVDEWRVVDKVGRHASYHPFILRTIEDHTTARQWCDENAPVVAPHRVMRVCLMEVDREL